MNDQSALPPPLPVQEDEGGNLIRSIPAIAWQRRWLILVPTVALTLVGTAAAYLIKPTYRSEATLVIESQQLPSDLVSSAVNDLVDQRIARVRQRVLSRPDLIQLVRQNNLYPEMQASQPLSKIIQTMRDNTHIEAVGSEANGFRGGATIAFTIAFDYPEPAPAQLVVQQYVNNFLDLDAKSRSEDAAGAANFLGEQATSLQRQIQDVEGQITQIKSTHGVLLSLNEQNGAMSPAAEAAQVDSQIAGIEAQNVQLRAMPAPSNDDGDVRAAEATYRSLQARYSDTHPDVIAAKNQLDAVRAAAAKRPKAGNPNDAMIKGNNARIASLQQTKALILSQGASLRAAQTQAPAVAERVNQLEQQAQGLRDQYAIISGKLQNAQVSSRMENENKGERLSIADPPIVPDTPFWPNRKLFIAGGLIGGLAVGLALALLLELLFKPIRGADSLREATGRPPMVVIPLLDRKPSLAVRLLERLSRRRLAKRPAAAA